MNMNIDWHSIFVPSEPILETIIRGTVMYLVLFVISSVFIIRPRCFW